MMVLAIDFSHMFETQVIVYMPSKIIKITSYNTETLNITQVARSKL